MATSSSADARSEATLSGPSATPPSDDAFLSPAELRRYGRHLTLDEIGPAGQVALRRARVLLVGAGGLGSPAALYLAAAGIGTIGLVDDDVVDESNLQRQVLHGTRDVGRSKLDSARDRLHDINPLVHVEAFQTRLSAANALEVARGFDVIVDGSDNFPTRYLTNDTSVLLGVPNVYGSVFRFEGQASVFATPDGPCYRCLFREPPPPGLVPSCAEAGVLGVLPGLIGTIQAIETLKLVLGRGEPLAGRLLLVDTLAMQFRTITIRRDPACPACGTHEITELVDYEAFCGTGAPAPAADAIAHPTPRDIATRLAAGEAIQLVDVREPYEWAIARIQGARLIPLRTLPDAVSSLDRDREVVLYCHAGVRSERAAELLREAGFTRVASMVGGIDRWSEDVDPSVPKY